MDNKNTVRVQISILSKMEKKVLVWIAKRLPKLMNSDHLTGIGLIDLGPIALH